MSAGGAACHLAADDSWARTIAPSTIALTTLASWALRPPARREPGPLNSPVAHHTVSDAQRGDVNDDVASGADSSRPGGAERDAKPCPQRSPQPKRGRF